MICETEVLEENSRRFVHGINPMLPPGKQSFALRRVSESVHRAYPE